MASDDEIENRFQEAHGAYLFKEGKPRAVLEVKRPHISTAIYEARLRGYDRAKSAKENPSRAREALDRPPGAPLGRPVPTAHS